MEIYNSLNKLRTYIEKNNYKGFDPYDALKSPLFRLPVLKNNKAIRFGTQQMVKRLPFNIRPFLFVPKGYNPVTLGLCIQAYGYLYQVGAENRDYYLDKIKFLVNELKSLVPEGFSGACWGYDFDWESRYAKIPAYQPTVVATGIITNALFVANQFVKQNDISDLIVSAAEFVKNDLNRTKSEQDDSICFSYSPFDREQVFNASMKGARLLAQTYFINRDEECKKLARSAVDFVVNNQNEDGSWAYSLSKTGGWIDNYHTGYVLDCIDEYQKLTSDHEFKESLDKGYSYYIKNFITTDGVPKFYDKNMYPVDCTAAAQIILTTIRFGDVERAEQVAGKMIQLMQKRNGSFKFRKFKMNTIATSFMRWSDAWMFAALSNLNYYINV